MVLSVESLVTQCSGAGGGPRGVIHGLAELEDLKLSLIRVQGRGIPAAPPGCQVSRHRRSAGSRQGTTVLESGSVRARLLLWPWLLPLLATEAVLES